jgi:hypothetical protein
VPDPESVTEYGAVDHRFLLCAQTSDLLYILVEFPPPTGRWSPDDRVPLWVVEASTAGGILPVLYGSRASNGAARPLMVAVHGAPAPSVESIDLELKDDVTTALTARAVRLTGLVTVPGVTVWMADPPPDPVSSVLNDRAGSCWWTVSGNTGHCSVWRPPRSSMS